MCSKFCPHRRMAQLALMRHYIGAGVTILKLLYIALSFYLHLPSAISVSHHLHIRLRHHLYVISISFSLPTV
jgi:hypothetical protein